MLLLFVTRCEMGVWQKRHFFILLAHSSHTTTSPHGSNLTFCSCSEQTEQSIIFIGGIGFEVDGGGVRISELLMTSDSGSGWANLQKVHRCLFFLLSQRFIIYHEGLQACRLTTSKILGKYLVSWLTRFRAVSFRLLAMLRSLPIQIR